MLFLKQVAKGGGVTGTFQSPLTNVCVRVEMAVGVGKAQRGIET